MKRISLIVLLLVFLSGCTESDSRKYVKNVLISEDGDKYTFTAEVYDFSSPEEKYETLVYTGDKLEQLCITASEKESYNFRLCENVYISAGLFEDRINNIVNVINSLKIPPSVNLLCFISSSLPSDDLPDNKLYDSKLYDLSHDNNNINGLFRITDDKLANLGAVLVSDGEPVRMLSENQWKILNIITEKRSEMTYVFRENEMYCVLENCRTFFSFDEELDIDIYVSIRDYKGVNNSLTSKEMMYKFLKDDIQNTAYELYNDIIISEKCNLHWYCLQKGKECTGVNIEVTII